jgi:hypothetical protein
MLRDDSYLDPPAVLAGRHFQRYMVDTADQSPCAVERGMSTVES